MKKVLKVFPKCSLTFVYKRADARPEATVSFWGKGGRPFVGRRRGQPPQRSEGALLPRWSAGRFSAGRVSAGAVGLCQILTLRRQAPCDRPEYGKSTTPALSYDRTITATAWSGHCSSEHPRKPSEGPKGRASSPNRRAPQLGAVGV